MRPQSGGSRSACLLSQTARFVAAAPLCDEDAPRDLALEAKLKQLSSPRSVAARWFIIAIFAVLLPPSVYFALKVQQDNSLDRLVVQTDPTSREQALREGLRPRRVRASCSSRPPDPFAADVLHSASTATRAPIGKVPHVAANSKALSIFKRVEGWLRRSPTPPSEFQAVRHRLRSVRAPGLIGEHQLACAHPRRRRPPRRRQRGRDRRRARALSTPTCAVHRHARGRPSPTSTRPSTPTRVARAPNIFRSSSSSSSASTGALSLVPRTRLLGPYSALSARGGSLTIGWVGITRPAIITIVSSLVPMTI